MTKQIVKISGTELVKRNGKYLSPFVGSYIHRFTEQIMEEQRKVTPEELALVHFGSDDKIRRSWVVWHAWRDYQTLQNRGIMCYPCYDEKSRGGRILFYKIFNRDKTDQIFIPIYRRRLRSAKKRTADRLDIVLDLIGNFGNGKK
jgi:hypothetical protein